ncbi:hypothetical protein FRC09_008408 [Ceratobasidium sp. 395]|nr:hypothetical protein FRC09_008408 [Ceratobasidium sp. 395]
MPMCNYVTCRLEIPVVGHINPCVGKKMIFNDVLAWIDDPDGKALPEYQTRELDDNTIECWIPSTEGMNFRIRFIPMEWLQPGFDIECLRRLDGVNLGSSIVFAREIKAGADITTTGEPTSSSTMRLFSFGKRILTDREDVASSRSVQKEDLNTIRLTFEFGRAASARTRTKFKSFKENGPIHEKAAKKGHAGSAGLGNTKTISYTPMVCTFRPETSIEPIVFIFRYAPEDWLQARGIIPSENASQLKRERSATPDVIDVDDLEIEDDEVMIIKHLVPASMPMVSNKKRRVKEEEDVKPNLGP